MTRSAPPRPPGDPLRAARVVLVAYPGIQPLDLVGPHEVFAGANSALGREAYALTVAAPATGPVAGESGLAIVATRSLRAEHRSRTAIDTVIVAGGAGVHAFRADRSNTAALSGLAARSRRVASVCSGTFALASAGVLDGRRVTTHWARAERLANEHPELHVEPDAIYVRDGSIWTSAGVTAGIDLALALVEDDHGPTVARTVAKWMVVFLRRPGGQSQFSDHVMRAPTGREAIRDVCAEVRAQPDGDLSVASLARRAAMSERHFVRVFTAEVGVPPGRYVDEVRLEVARAALEAESSVEAAARTAGYGSVETMRRQFQSALGIGPSAYRDRFAARGA